MVATSGVPVAMASAAGSEKPSYREGTQATAARADQVDEFGVGDALDELDGAFEAVALDGLGDRPVVGALADDDEVGVGVLGAHLGERLDEEDQALEGHVRAGGGDDPAGHLGHRGVRREEVGVGADVDDVDAVLATPRWSTISWREVPETVSTDGRRRATRFCMRVKAYQRRTEAAAPEPSAASSSNCRSTVMGWWMVVTSGAPTSPEQSVAERLVVVDDVELAAPGAQMAAGAQGEGQRLGEPAGPHRADLQGVDPVAVLAAPGGAEGVGLAVEVEAGQFGEGEAVVVALVEDGVGLGRR